MLHARVALITNEHPAAVALRLPEAEISFGALDARATRLARALADLGVRRGDRVAIWQELGVEHLATRMAAGRLRAVPIVLDPGAPIEATAKRLVELGPKVLVAPARRAATILRDALDHLVVITPQPAPGMLAFSDADAQEAAPIDEAAEETDLALVAHPAGEDDAPAVCHSHRSLEASAGWLAGALRIGPADRVVLDLPQVAPLSTAALFGGLGAGASLVIPPAEVAADASAAVGLINRAHATILAVSATALDGLVEGGLLAVSPGCLRAILIGDGAPPTPLARRIHLALPAVRVLGLFGTLETGLCAVEEVRSIPADDGPLPLGRPFAGAKLKIGGSMGRQGTGPLTVEGPGVSVGHIGESPSPGGPRNAGIWVRADALGDLFRVASPEPSVAPSQPRQGAGAR